ncbi:sugar ABC transporter permease [Microbacterium trichothecenolyticum]|uniref:Sugar ABC transporter permease n=1 Tax=Microbacterium ureisolvens TaxID=2781186 RepID=A0ABS7I2P9_9MICO|nr:MULTISPECIES: sugar ABC transporter permease [Microbacterium]MBW9111952.1 sugar ABC transporter permease [Microbacterium ureisolvens]MBW9122379.1 sugar ABC transporter permease [Microbacterium trichothecenolyticum]
MDKVLGDRRAILLFLSPALLLYTVIMLVPIVWSTGYTFVEGNPISGFEPVGIDNYIKLIGDPTFWQATLFSVKYAVVVTLAQVAAGLGLALLYVFYLRRSSALVRTLVFFPIVLPTAAVAQMFVKLFEIVPQQGPVNAFVEWLGFDAVNWLGQPDTAFLILVVMDVWRSMGFYAVLLYAGLVTIPDDVIEAARLDGAHRWTLVRHIVLPFLLPVLVSALIFSINGSLKVFDSVFALTDGGPNGATTPLTLAMFRTSFSYMEYGYGSTIAMALTILSLIVTVAIFRGARKDVTV